MYHEWDFPKAAQLISKAVKLEPGNASVLNTNAVLMGILGRREQSISLLEDALERDPFSMSVLSNLTVSYLNTGRLDDAAGLIERIRAVEPSSYRVDLNEAWLTWFQGDAEAALDRFTDVGGPAGYWGRPFALYDLGRDDEIDDAILALLDAGGRPSQVAAVHAYRGDLDQAFAAFDQAYAEKDDWLIQIREFKFIESLHKIRVGKRCYRRLASLTRTPNELVYKKSPALRGFFVMPVSGLVTEVEPAVDAIG